MAFFLHTKVSSVFSDSKYLNKNDNVYGMCSYGIDCQYVVAGQRNGWAPNITLTSEDKILRRHIASLGYTQYRPYRRVSYKEYVIITL